MSSGGDWVLVEAGLGLAAAAFVLSWLLCAGAARGLRHGLAFWTGPAVIRATNRPCLWAGASQCG